MEKDNLLSTCGNCGKNLSPYTCEMIDLYKVNPFIKIWLYSFEGGDHAKTLNYRQ